MLSCLPRASSPSDSQDSPGVYHMQDPRSRVYNFDPYLQKVTPVSSFDFDALKPFVTSSKDTTLVEAARANGLRYTGSSSSMTGPLAHLHYLLSQWREINCDTMSRGFASTLKTFTRSYRGPNAVFLRWKDGAYAIDIDRQFESVSVLSMLGLALEKFLTLPKSEFERYMKSSENLISKEKGEKAASYHYSTAGNLLMRAQLDAHDPRLPGTGMFDLKTRAVASIRMNSKQHEIGLGYEIRHRLGNWESFEREYFDMMRAAFLKYSLQVRIGRMDGILVAYHNVERIFGFQYISLPEMDLTMHGTSDTTIGDEEFGLSLGLLNKILDAATKKFPKRSLRIHFETREAATPFMYIYAEPVTEERMEEIQSANQAKSEARRRELLELIRPDEDNERPSQRASSVDGWQQTQAQVVDELDQDRTAAEGGSESEGEGTDDGSNAVAIEELTPYAGDNADADADQGQGQGRSAEDYVLEGFSDEPTEGQQTGGEATESRELLAMTLKILNKVNGSYVVRPTRLSKGDRWTIEYSLAEMKSPARAWKSYDACRLRRSELYDETQVEITAYMQNLHNLCREGRRWRKEQDARDAEAAPVVLGQSSSTDS